MSKTQAQVEGAMTINMRSPHLRPPGSLDPLRIALECRNALLPTDVSGYDPGCCCDPSVCRRCTRWRYVGAPCFARANSSFPSALLFDSSKDSGHTHNDGIVAPLAATASTAPPPAYQLPFLAAKTRKAPDIQPTPCRVSVQCYIPDQGGACLHLSHSPPHPAPNHPH